ncbi:MAG: tRNA lysidine(34) synthetase TilS [Lentisphaeraceae bacterium]|nr:tRNA lysidine(34) synthetase TilS [Lentisphaeraceae bacterium]
MKINLQKLHDFKNVYLGFSGGADSTALAHILKKSDIPFEAIHFHHHLREESADKDAEFCKNFCSQESIPFRKIDLDVNTDKKNGESIEAAARRLRQKWWQENTDTNSIVLLAHHLDDQRENFILRAMRGSSATGLTGFSESKVISGVLYFRPLFYSSRQDILSYLESNKLKWREDESNEDTKFNRNRVRSKIIPELAKLGSLHGLDRTISNTKHDADFLEESAQNWISNTAFTTQTFLEVHDALKARVIRLLFLEKENSEEYYPSHDAIQRLTQECSRSHDETISVNLTAEHVLKIDTNGAIYLPPQQFSISWDPTKQEVIETASFRLTATQVSNPISKTHTKSFSISELPEKLVVRSWLLGDKILPEKRSKEVKVKKLLNNHKLSSKQKAELPFLTDGENILWIPGIERTKDSKAKHANSHWIISCERL